MKPRHFWAIYSAKTHGQKKPSGELTKNDKKRLRLLLEREKAKHAANNQRPD